MPRRLIAVLALFVAGVLGVGVTTAFVRSGDAPGGKAAPLPAPSVSPDTATPDPTPDPLPTDEPTSLPTPEPTVGADGSGQGTTGGTAAPPDAPITPNTGSGPVVPALALLLLGAAVAVRLRTT